MYRRNYNDDLDWGYNPNYPRYEFSDTGLVWDTVKKKYLKVSYPKKSAPVVGLYDKHGEYRVVNLAKIMLETFRKDPGPDHKLYYRDNNKHNIHITNLDWKYVEPNDRKDNRPCIKGRPDIPTDEYYRNTYIRVKETGKKYDNIWEYIDDTGEKELIAKRSIRYPYPPTSKGYHLVPYLYDDGMEQIYLEGQYE